MCLHGDDRQALALEAGDDLAGQAARERVRLDQDQGSFHGGSSVSAVAVRRERLAGPAGSRLGSAAPAGSATVGWSVVWRRRRRAEGGVRRAVSASQNGQMRHAGSIGLPHE